MPAIEEAIAAGINVNVTLLFSVESYTAIAEAYIRGHGASAGGRRVARRALGGELLRLAGGHRGGQAPRGARPRGPAWVAGGRQRARRLQRFKELFRGERFAALRDAGAPVQRPLWASTGVKDPRYPETKYVDELVGPRHREHDADAHAARLRGGARGRAAPPRIRTHARTCERARGRRNRHGRRDEEAAAEGIEKFVEPFDDADRRDRAGPRGRSSRAGRRRSSRRCRTSSSRRSSSACSTAEAEDVAKRIWAHDESLWGGPGVPEIGNRLGWLTISDKMLEHASELHEFAERPEADGLEHAVLLGMGGSSLGPEVIRRSLRRDARRHAAARARLDGPRRGASTWSARWTSTRRSSSSRRSPAARSRRSRTCATSTSAPAATARASAR